MKKLLVLLAIVMMSANAYALDLSALKANLYGQIYLDTFYMNDSREMHFLNSGKNADRSYFDVDLLGLTRVGLDLEFGKFTGKLEVGVSDPNFLRLYYVSYNSDKFGQFLLGQDWTIAGYTFGQVSMDANEMCDYGAVNTYRRPQLKYTIAGFAVALVHSGSDNGLNSTISGDTERNQYIPRVELAYTYENNFLYITGFGAYGYYSTKLFTDASTGNSKTYSSSSYHVGVGGKVSIADAFINFTGYYGVNMYLSNALTGGILGDKAGITPTLVDGGISNVQSAGGAIAVGYKIGMFTPQIGFGYNASFNKHYTDNSNDAYMAFINSAIQFNEWLSFTPEIAFIDEMKDGYGKKQGQRFIAGGQFLVAFE